MTRKQVTKRPPPKRATATTKARTKSPSRKPVTIDEYLAPIDSDQRAALEKLRRMIKRAVPQAEECINYGIAAFRLNGRVLVGFGAAAAHCTFFPMNGHTVADFKDDLKNFDTSKGAIRFQPAKPLPAALVRKILRARIAENQAQDGKPKKRAPV